MKWKAERRERAALRRSESMRTRSLCAGATLVATLVPTAASAFELRTTPNGKEVTWSTSTVSLAIDPSVVQGVYSAVDAVNESARAWRSAAAAPPILVGQGNGADEI